MDQILSLEPYIVPWISYGPDLSVETNVVPWISCGPDLSSDKRCSVDILWTRFVIRQTLFRGYLVDQICHQTNVVPWISGGPNWFSETFINPVEL